MQVGRRSVLMWPGKVARGYQWPKWDCSKLAIQSVVGDGERSLPVPLTAGQVSMVEGMSPSGRGRWQAVRLCGRGTLLFGRSRLGNFGVSRVLVLDPL